MHKGSLFSMPSSTLISSPFDNSHPTGFKEISHCGFDLPFPDDSWCWAPFYIPVGHFLCLPWKNIYSGPLLIFKLSYLVLFFAIELYKFFIYFGYYPLNRYVLCNIFSRSVGCHFILLTVSFVVQKNFSLMQSCSFISGFVAWAFAIISRKLWSLRWGHVTFYKPCVSSIHRVQKAYREMLCLVDFSCSKLLLLLLYCLT